MDDLTNTIRPADHDLLIELRTEMRGLRQDLKALSDGLTNRVTNLEKTKAEKEEVRQEIEKIASLIQNNTASIIASSSETDKDYESRLRSLEKNSEDNTNVKKVVYGAVAFILITVLGALVYLVINHQ